MHTDIFAQISEIENLFAAWREFRRGKRSKHEVQEFELNLENNLFTIRNELVSHTYKHGSYKSFRVRDPKLRHIHKALVKDRVLHQAVFRVLYQIFDKSFVFDSYSCRRGKGTHAAVKRLEEFSRKLSYNHKHNFHVLKCDIRKFFDSVNKDVLTELIQKRIMDSSARWFIQEILGSFSKTDKTGLPLGNVTSQLFANIYMNEFDQFVKRKLGVKYYLRYSDDFIILSRDKNELLDFIPLIREFLRRKLILCLHEDKIILRKYSQGIDFLGYVVLPYHRVLRTKTKRRIFKKVKARKRELEAGAISERSFNQSLQSYFGVLKHCCGEKVKKEILRRIGV